MVVVVLGSAVVDVFRERGRGRRVFLVFGITVVTIHSSSSLSVDLEEEGRGDSVEPPEITPGLLSPEEESTSGLGSTTEPSENVIFEFLRQN